MHDIPTNMHVQKTASSCHIQPHISIGACKLTPWQVNAVFPHPECLIFTSPSEDGAITGMCTVLLVNHSVGMGLDSLQEVYKATISCQNCRGGSDNFMSSSLDCISGGFNSHCAAWYPPTHPIPIPLGGGSSNPPQIGAPKSSTYLGKWNTHSHKAALIRKKKKIDFRVLRRTSWFSQQNYDCLLQRDIRNNISLKSTSA